MKRLKIIGIVIGLMALILFSGCEDNSPRKTDFYNSSEYCKDVGYDGYINHSWTIGYCHKDYRKEEIVWEEVKYWYEIKYNKDLEVEIYK